METFNKITFELDEGDVALLLGHLGELSRRIPSGIRDRSPWTRIRQQLIARVGQEMVNEQVRALLAGSEYGSGF
jgi:hypothetical protein